MAKQGGCVKGLFLLSAIAAIGCQPPESPPEEQEWVVVEDGKADNFFSNVAQEYLAEATVQLRLEDRYAQESPEKQLAGAQKLMEGKAKQIAWFLHIYLIDKSSDHSDGPIYGGMRAMVLDGSEAYEALSPDPLDPLAYTFRFSVQVGGTNKLLEKIKQDAGLDSASGVFPLQLAKLANTKVISFDHSAYDADKWSPETCNCELEAVPLKLTPIAPSQDAYIDYSGMLDDGVMDIAIHFGWDYHARYDLELSRRLYDWLVQEMGFSSPAASYEELNRLSGPLTREMQVNGQTVSSRVWVFRPDPCESWDEAGWGGSWAKAVKEDENNKKRACPDYAWSDAEANANPTTSQGAGNLMADLKAGLKSRDVVIFSGHSGYTYGYALGSWYRTSAGDLDPPEIRTLDLPAERSQLFVVSGCDTYHVGQAFKENPNKLGLVNADVITTTSFSRSSDVSDTQDIIRALVGDEYGTVRGVSYGQMMKDLNPSDNDWGHFFTMFGLHGIDDNPLADPLGDASKACTPCDTDNDCGAAGNVCVRLSEQEKVCAVRCLHDDGCGAEQECRQFGNASTAYIAGRACVPQALSCASVPEPPAKEFTAEGELARGEIQSYSVLLDEAAKNIRVQLSGTADADLYTRFNGPPTLTSYDCRPYTASSHELCEYAQPAGSALQIMVRGYAARSSFSLKVTWE